ncbi:Cyclophilin-like domain,Cyclophilin-type peptidyl-prolyl cis-trans isomerase domain,Cyclophilin- [Cinara cedri]|uniref:Peptidyl-prolyl cis-trans isomerase n=1 Tax=Cinara cedri TaxID=506608 RepID=A0A5E4NSZ2_9HEMI|nr:Cyclophilin-like domain,Cyclophilin-type peptidyl-prolyl cis-trans isomerase domain,Cyclophilin- [Cinara cedri]
MWPTARFGIILEFLACLSTMFGHHYPSAAARNVQTFTVTDVAYLDVEMAGQGLGRIEIGLFGDAAPKTVANFVTILTQGIGGRTYAGTKFHRVIEKFVIQGGDILNNDGSGSISIYGDTFPDENLIVNGTKPGFVGMANSGPDSNGCQFFITTRPTPSLNGQHVLFGLVLDGQKFVHIIERQRSDHLGRPTKEIRIKKCGLLGNRPPFVITDFPYSSTIWQWISATAIPLSMSSAILLFFQWVIYQINKMII